MFVTKNRQKIHHLIKSQAAASLKSEVDALSV